MPNPAPPSTSYIPDLLGTPGLALTGVSLSGTPGNIFVPIPDAQGNVGIPGSLISNLGFPGQTLTGLNGNTSQQINEFIIARSSASNSVILPGTSTTNSFNTTLTSGSVGCIQSTTNSSTLNNSGGMVQILTVGGGYVGNNTGFTANVVASNVGGGSVSTCNLNVLLWRHLGNTLGANMTTGTAQTVTSSVSTLSWPVTPGTLTPALTSGSFVQMEIDFNQTNVSGSNSIQITDIYFS